MVLRSILMTIIAVCLSSCSTFMSMNTGEKTISSSLVTYLYPNEESRLDHNPEIPVLTLPASVGIAFVPSSNSIASKNQIELLQRVKNSFIQYDFIERIELIPNTYLQERGGFASLEQVARLYDVDIMALVSYDQVSQSYENNAALLYWTIVGMYVIPGNENSVQTFVDTAVFDIKSKKMLFRAPGISKLEERTTAVGIDETLSDKSIEGFELAVSDMIINLNDELDSFKIRVKEEEIANIEYKEGYKGAVTEVYVILLMFFALVIRLFRKG